MSDVSRRPFDTPWASQAAVSHEAWHAIAAALAYFIGPPTLKGPGAYVLHCIAEDDPARIVDAVYDALVAGNFLTQQ